jgi:hypothetical protein
MDSGISDFEKNDDFSNRLHSQSGCIDSKMFIYGLIWPLSLVFCARTHTPWTQVSLS